jgi:hypothetical protein
VTDYDPYPTVTFAGTTTYADNTIANISIANGRTDVTEQPQPSFARVELWSDASDPLDVALSQSVSIAIAKGTSGTQEIFYGNISDIEIEIDAYGSDGSIARYTITAVGPLALLNRRLGGTSGYNKENDGTRILNILSEAFLTEWDDVAPTLTWAGLPVGVTWASYDAVGQALVDNLVTNIDVPGQYELMAYSAETADAYTLATTAANSGRGVLWEGGDGDIHYDDYLARNSATILTLTADDILAQGLRTAAQVGEIVNDATVTYRAGTANARDEQSIILYGQLAGTRETVLHNLTDAENQAADFIESRAYPRMYPEEITVPLHSPTVSDATRDSLAAIYNGVRIQTTALPSVFGTEFDGFVEGFNWNLTRYTADLTLICSAYSETYSSIIWYQVPPTQDWATYNASIQWEDL